MKFLVLGCNGMAGHMIAVYLKEQGHDVIGFARRQSKYVDTVTGNVKDTDKLRNTVWGDNFDAVVNCVGLLTQKSEEHKAEAVFINGYLPHFLAEITKGMHTRVVQMSTDCVFSGRNGWYGEHDLRDGESFYDRSKALGELEDDKNVTIRCSIIGPDLNPDGAGLFNWFLKAQGAVHGYTNVFWNGQTTLQYAKTVEAAVHKGLYGVCHLVPEGCISKNDLLVLFNRYFRNDSIQILPKRDVFSNKCLKRTIFDFDIKVPGYEYMISELALWMMRHKEMYPHYYLNRCTMEGNFP